MNAPTEQPIPLLDLKAQHATIADDIHAAYQRVIDAQAFIMARKSKPSKKKSPSGSA